MLIRPNGRMTSGRGREAAGVREGISCIEPLVLNKVIIFLLSNYLASHMKKEHKLNKGNPKGFSLSHLPNYSHSRLCYLESI